MADETSSGESKYFTKNQVSSKRNRTKEDLKSDSDLKKYRKNSVASEEETQKSQNQGSMLASCEFRLKTTEFAKSSLELAVFLLGKVIHRVMDNGEVLVGRIVETEAYLGEEDKACHCYGGKRTNRTEPMYMDPGTAYIYFIYGMYYCLNISSNDVGGCVLIRALQPIAGQDTMQRLRSVKKKDGSPLIKEHALCNGPSKLCTALAITKDSLNKENMASSSKFWIERDQPDCLDNEIVKTKRIGIDSYGVEWASKPFRFYISGNKCVSSRDKIAEKAMV